MRPKSKRPNKCFTVDTIYIHTIQSQNDTQNTVYICNMMLCVIKDKVYKSAPVTDKFTLHAFKHFKNLLYCSIYATYYCLLCVCFEIR